MTIKNKKGRDISEYNESGKRYYLFKIVNLKF